MLVKFLGPVAQLLTNLAWVGLGIGWYPMPELPATGSLSPGRALGSKFLTCGTFEQDRWRQQHPTEWLGHSLALRPMQLYLLLPVQVPLAAPPHAS